MTTYSLIHHICHSPQTGVWAVMKTLAQWQEREHPGSVAIVVVADDLWPHRDELGTLGVRTTFIDIPRLPHGYALPYLLATRVWRRVNRAIEPDGIAHFHNAWMSGALIGFKAMHPSVVTVHGIPATSYIEAERVRAAMHRFLARMTVNSGATMVSVDREAVQRFSLLFHTSEVSFSLVTNGVVDAHIAGCPFLRGDQQFTVGFLGMLDDRKGWQIVCSAVEALAHAGKKVRLLIAGDGPAKAQDAAHKSCASIGNGSAYLGWVARPNESVVPTLDVLALPSNAEGLPMAVLECLSAGVPIVCTHVGGLGSLLTNGQDCIFVERNPARVADAIGIMISDSTLHRDMSRNARVTYERFGSVEQMGRGYETAYETASLEWLKKDAPS